MKNKTHSNIKSTYTVETSNSNNQTNQLEQAIVEIEISSLSSPDDSNLLKTTAFINDIEVPIIIDTGAGQSILPSFLIEKHKIKTNNSNITCKFGNNSKQHNVPSTDPLDVVVFDTSVNLEFLPSTNVLLGIDWLNLTEAIVCPYNKSLIFKQRQVFLETDNHKEKDDDYYETTDILSSELEPIDFIFAEESDQDYYPLKSTKIEFLPIAHVDKTTNDKLLNILEEYRDVFATSVDDLKIPCTLGEHKIDTQNHNPIAIKPYRKSQYENQLIEEEVKSLLQANIIKPSKSPWAAPVLLVPKPDNTKRMCVNFKKLNNITIKDAYPIPRIDEIFTRLSKSKFYTKFDFRQAYYQIKMHDDSIEKTAFATSSGLYEFNR